MAIGCSLMAVVFLGGHISGSHYVSLESSKVLLTSAFWFRILQLRLQFFWLLQDVSKKQSIFFLFSIVFYEKVIFGRNDFEEMISF